MDDWEPTPAERKRALHFGWTICAASVRPPGLEHETPIPCRRRPRRKPCNGHLRVLLCEVPERVHWRCPACGDAGQLDGWRDNVWNVRGWGGSDERPRVELVVSRHEYRLMRELVAGPEPTIARAELLDGGDVRLEAGLSDMEELLEVLCEVLHEEPRSRHRRALECVYERIEETRQEVTQPGAREARLLATAIREGHAPDERLTRFFEHVADEVEVPFTARLDGDVVEVQAIVFEPDPRPALSAVVLLQGARTRVSLGLLDVDVHPSWALLSLYKDWWTARLRAEAREERRGH